jgi:hypothetical protein
MIVNVPWVVLDDYVTFGGWFLIICLVLMFFKVNYAFNIWLALDVVVCSIVHGTRHRTISGWAGQRMDTSKRYYYIAKVIDLLFRVIGDDKGHCKRAYEWERSHIGAQWMD